MKTNKSVNIPMKKYILVMLLSSAYIYAQAQVAANDELKNLVNSALNYQPKLKAAAQSVEFNKLQADIARGGYYPEVALIGSADHLDPVNKANFPGLGTFAFSPANVYDAHVGLSWSVWDFGKTKYAVEKALADMQTSKDNVEAAKAMYAYQLAKVYYAIIYYRQAIKVNDAQIASLEDSRKIVMARLDNGDATQFDKLTMDVRLNAARNTKSDLENTLQQYTILLQTLTGTPANITHDKMDVNATGATTNTSFSNNWDILLSKDKITSIQAEDKASKIFYAPQLSIVGQAGYKNGYFNDNNLKEMKLNSVVGAGITWPLFAGGRLHKASQLSQIALEAAKYDEQSTEIDVQRNIAQNASDIKTLVDKYNTMPEQVKQAEDALTLAQSRYKNGVIRELELIDAQNNVSSVQLQKLQYEYQLCVAELTQQQLQGAKIW